jgi:hypothetical protein
MAAEQLNAEPLAARRIPLIDPAPRLLVLPKTIPVRRDSSVATLVAQMDDVVDAAQIAHEMLRERARWGGLASSGVASYTMFQTFKVNDASGAEVRLYGIRFYSDNT